MQTGRGRVSFPGTIQGNEINCSAERNVPMAKDISQMIDREGWKDFLEDFLICQSPHWSLISRGKAEKPNKSTADWRVEILRDSRSERVPDYRSFHDPSSSRHRRLYVEFYGCSSVSDAKYHLWKFPLSDSALLKQLVKVPPRNRCSAMHHKTPLLQPPQKNKFA